MKNIFKLISIILFLASTVISLLAIQSHEGNILNYLIFCVLINFLLIYTLNTQSLFFEIYFAAFIWLGFWFKYSFSLIFLDGIIYDSGPNINMANIDKAISTSIVAISAVFLGFVFRKKFFREKNYTIKDISFFEDDKNQGDKHREIPDL